MLTRIVTLSIVLLASALSMPQAAAKGVAYWKCADPQSCTCLALTNEDKVACPQCGRWLEMTLDRFKYGYGRTTASARDMPRANVFLNDMAHEIYGQDLPKTKYGHPILMKDFYNDPESFGWRIVEPASAEPGSLVLWPTFGGVVMGKVHGEPRVLYPSHQKGGELTFSDASALGAKPKFVAPQEPEARR